jgi:lysophospholipase L1-like esterase
MRERKAATGSSTARAGVLMSLLSTAACLLLSCSGSGTADSSPVIDIGDNNPGIVLLSGDSVTSGADSPGSRGYATELQRLLAEQGKQVTVVNRGRPAAKSHHIDEANANLWKYKPAVSVLQYGLNDALVIHENTPKAIVDNLRHMIYAGLDNKSIVVLCTLTPTCGYRTLQNEKIQEANEGFRSLVSEFEDYDSFVLADIGAAFAENDPEGGGCALINTSSYNHPTLEGYALMAAVIAAALEPLAW